MKNPKVIVEYVSYILRNFNDEIQLQEENIKEDFEKLKLEQAKRKQTLGNHPYSNVIDTAKAIKLAGLDAEKDITTATSWSKADNYKDLLNRRK